MLRLKFTDDITLRRLRWVMSAAMIFSFLNTLAGQPKSFWVNPETAIRGDGLGVHNPVNHTFEFFLSQGWQPYVATFLIYLALAFVTVSLLPRKWALFVIFSVIFGHCYGAINWMAVRWHLGSSGIGLYAVGISAAIVIACSDAPFYSSDKSSGWIRRLMFAVMITDALFTLIGQPSSYWLSPETVHEGNPFWRWVMLHGWYAYVAGDLIYCGCAYLLARSSPRFLSWVCALGFIFSHFVGGTNWLFYEWRLGMAAPVIYGAIISLLLVWKLFARPIEGRASYSSGTVLQNTFC